MCMEKELQEVNKQISDLYRIKTDLIKKEVQRVIIPKCKNAVGKYIKIKEFTDIDFDVYVHILKFDKNNSCFKCVCIENPENNYYSLCFKNLPLYLNEHYLEAVLPMAGFIKFITKKQFDKYLKKFRLD